MKKNTLLLILSLLVTMTLPSLSCGETEIYAGVEGFRWKDPDLGVTLNGPVGLVGIATRIRPPQSILSVELRGEGFGGEIEDDDVDGAETGILGVKLQGDIGLAAKPAPGVILEPFAGLGIRWWEFEGIDEIWRSSYGRIGLRTKFSSPTAPVQFTMEGGARLPLGARVHSPDGVFDPDEEAAPFAEIGLRSDVLKITAFYEGLRFSNPDIDNDIFGVRLGVVLR